MRTLFLSIVLLILAQAGYATVVTVSAGASGHTTTSTKTTGDMLVNNGTNRGYAVFDLAAAGIPATAVITNVKVTFTHVKTGSGGASMVIYGYEGDISGLSAASLYSGCITSDAMYTANWGNSSTTKTMNSTAAADTFIKHNLSNTVSLTWVLTGSTRSYTITGAPSPYLTITYTCTTPTGVSVSTNSNSLCSGSNYDLSGNSSSATTYAWVGPNGYTSTLKNPAAFATSTLSAGVYTFTATSSCGISVTATSTPLVVKIPPAAIAGASSVCVGASTSLTNTSPLGTWSTSSFTRATVNSSTGLVIGRSAGSVNISYTTGCGSAVGLAMTVKGTPAAIGGSAGVCIGGSVTLTNATAGGTWSSSNPGIASINSATGQAFGISAGTVTITYDNGGCGIATRSLTSNNTAASITGATTVCTDATITLANTTSGGVWTSGNTSRASVNPSTGVVTGVGAGSVTISYATGCGSAVTQAITVSTSPNAITGTLSVCTGAATALNCTPGSGTWSCSNPALATINSSGVVTGLSTGYVNMTYTRSGCISTAVFAVKTTPNSITGAADICAGTTVALANTSIAGTWTSSNASIASVHPTSGIVTGIGAGTVSISYTTCGSPATASVTVFTTPANITGTTNICQGATSSLANATPGGTWSTSNAAVVSVNASGVISGVNQGAATISYAISTCIATIASNIKNAPSAISGTTDICLGNTSLLTNTSTGGTWTTSNAAVASVDAAGLVTSIAQGTANISYTTGCGSAAVAPVNVGIVPAAITGTSAICSGNNTTLTQSVAGGSWTTSNATLASVSNTGIVTGIAEGNPVITYTLTNGCGTNSETFNMNISQTGKWLGINSDWNDATNWPCGTIPSATIDAIIPTGTDFLPDLTGADFTVKNFTVEAGVVLPIDEDANVNVKGNLLNNGTINGDGHLKMNGSSAQVFGGNGSVSNLTIDNASGVTGTTNDTLNVMVILEVTSGTLTTNGGIRLAASASQSAVLGNVAGSISGNITVETYFEGGRRAYRFLGHPFSHSINLNQVGRRIDVTGAGGATRGFTPTASNAASVYWYNPIFGNSAAGYDPGWRAFTSANGNVDTNEFKQHQGIRLFVRGSKGEGLGYNPYTPSAVVMSLVGQPNFGTQNINLRKGINSDYNQIANPFASPVNIGNAIAAAQTGGQIVGSAFYIWNPFLGSAGAFQSKPIGGSYIIDQCTSFQVRAANDGATLTINESDKANVADETLLRTASVDQIELNVYDANMHQWDGTSIKFDETATANEDIKADGLKLTNPDLNFYSVSANNQKLSIDARPFTEGAIIPLGFTTNVAQEYIIKADALNIPSGKVVMLVDKYTNTTTTLENGTEYRFTISSNPASQGDQRFELRTSDNATTTTSTTGFDVTMTPNPATDNITVTYNASTAAAATVNITNAAGQKVMTQNLGNNQSGKATISLSQLSSGIYFVTVASGNDTKTMKLIVE